MVTDSSGNKVEGIAYYPYGQTRTDSGSVSVKHKYTGQELDSSTGLYFYNARYYDPSLGRFISADSIIPDPSDPQSFNRYSYVRNNPINYIDPTGHWSIKIGGTKISGDDKVLAAAIVVATGGAALAYGGPLLYGALIGEIAGGYNADKAGGNVLQGVFIGGVTGAITGAMFSAANTMTAGANPLIQIGAKGFVGGTISHIMGGSFEKGFMYAAAAATLYWGYTEMAGTEPTMAPGENNLPNGQYDTRLNGGRPPQGSNVTGLNDGQGGIFSQGGPVSNVGNTIPGINATAHLHDYWMNNMEFDQIRNIGTMVPAAVMSYGAQLSGQLAPLTVQQSVNDSR